MFIKSKGMSHGSFRRIGASDQLCIRGDFKHLYHLGLPYGYEEEVLRTSCWQDIDLKAVEQYRRMRQLIYPDASELQLSDENLLLSLKCAVSEHGQIVPTVAGIVLFVVYVEDVRPKFAYYRHIINL